MTAGHWLPKGSIKEVADCGASINSDGQLSFSVSLLDENGEPSDMAYGLESFDVIKVTSAELVWEPPVQKVYVEIVPKEVE